MCTVLHVGVHALGFTFLSSMFRDILCDYTEELQPVPEEVRLKMLVEMQIKILDGQSSGLFSNEPFKKRPVMTIEDFDIHFNDHFELHFLRNGAALRDSFT